MQVTRVVDGVVHWHTIPDYAIWIGKKVVARKSTFSEAYEYAISLRVVCSILAEKTQSRTVILPWEHNGTH